MADTPARESLLREMQRLAGEIGYAGFRLEYFNDAETIREWPDPATRERELRTIGMASTSGTIPPSATRSLTSAPRACRRTAINCLPPWKRAVSTTWISTTGRPSTAAEQFQNKDAAQDQER